MELHNTVEDIVITRVGEIFDSLERGENPEKFCTCEQCRTDTACYALNRAPPHYIVSSRGAARVQGETIERQQKEADIAALIYDGIRRVTHNQRPNFAHGAVPVRSGTAPNHPAYNIPAIAGRLFSGINFAPLADVTIELLRNGELVPMKDRNWQNPYTLVSNTAGTFTFWPEALSAESVSQHKTFEYSLRVSAPEFETLVHFFKIPVISEIQAAAAFTLGRTFKLPDLYMFPPGSSGEAGAED